MKRKARSLSGRVLKRSISLPGVLEQFAHERVAKDGFNSLSAYNAHLIRQDREKWAGRE